jgi:hypothetical protein
MDHGGRELLVDDNPRGEFLVDKLNRPVWPVLNDGDRRGLERIAFLFGARLREVKGMVARDQPDTAEVVVALGCDAEAAGRLYAHLTSRRVCLARTIGGISVGGHAPAILVASLQWLRNDTISHLYSLPSSASSPGMISGASEDLRRQALVRAAAATLSGPVVTRRILILPFVPTGRIRIRDGEIIGDQGSEGAIRSALLRGAGVLAIQTHSDGLDAHLPADLIVCPMDRIPVGAPGLLSNGCFQSGRCYRTRRLVSRFVESARYVSPDQMRARVLVWDVCWGAIPPTDVIDPAWGLGRRLLESPDIGALVTPWALAITCTNEMERLVRRIAAGMDVGHALYLHNRSSDALRLDRQMCLLGDPRIRLPSTPTEIQAISIVPTSAPRRLGARPRSREKAHTESGLNFLALLVRGMSVSVPTSLNLGGAADAALRAIDNYRRTAEAGRPTEGRKRAVGPELRNAMLRCFRRRGPSVFKEWLSKSRDIATIGRRDCFACGDPGNQATVGHATLWLPDHLVRRFVRCQRCGVVEDAPTHAAITMSVGAGQVRIMGQLPAANWRAHLIVRQQTRLPRLWWEWPPGRDGRPLNELRISVPWPLGLSVVGLVLMVEEELIVLSQFVQGGGTNDPLTSLTTTSRFRSHHRQPPD